jgi:hypothetical protein
MEALTTILNPGVLFFLLGLLAVLVGSNLHIPEPVVRFLSLYLMLAIGYRGGVSLYESEMFGDGMIVLAVIIFMSALVPVYSIVLLRRKVGLQNAAAIGATYGSNSTLTYITAAGFLTALDVPFAGYMTVALVVMETPAIILSVLLGRLGDKKEKQKSANLVVREAVTDGTLVVLVGSMLIGFLLRSMGMERSPLAAFIEGDMFTGMLVFFLLYMGTVVGTKLRGMRSFPLILAVFAVAAPVFNGLLALLLSKIFDLEPGDSLLLIVLCASASYIVAPAILRDTLPGADPAQYLSMSIGITFPLNIILGIPLYWWLVQQWI